MTTRDDNSKVDLPVVCTLTPATIATRKAGLLPGLVRQAESREEIADGQRSAWDARVLDGVD